MKHVKKHLGVKIFKVKEQIPGSDIKILKDGRLKVQKPKFETFYQYAGSFLYDSVEDCIKDIEECKKRLVELDSFDQKTFEEVMNKED